VCKNSKTQDTRNLTNARKRKDYLRIHPRYKPYDSIAFKKEESVGEIDLFKLGTEGLKAVNSSFEDAFSQQVWII